MNALAMRYYLKGICGVDGCVSINHRHHKEIMLRTTINLGGTTYFYNSDDNIDTVLTMSNPVTFCNQGGDESNVGM
jgi:hypothetical protein